jgi:hypothetical protein
MSKSDVARISKRIREEEMNAAVQDLHEAIRLEGEKTREDLKDFITGTVIAREGHPVEAAEQILDDEESSSVN